MNKTKTIKALVLVCSIALLVACFGINIDAKLQDYETALNEGDLTKAEELRAELVKFEEDGTTEFKDAQAEVFAEKQVKHFKLACEQKNEAAAKNIYNRFEKYQLSEEQLAEVNEAMLKAGYSFEKKEQIDPEKALNELEEAYEYGDVELAKELMEKLESIKDELNDEQVARLNAIQ